MPIYTSQNTKRARAAYPYSISHNDEVLFEFFARHQDNFTSHINRCHLRQEMYLRRGRSIRPGLCGQSHQLLVQINPVKGVERSRV